MRVRRESATPDFRPTVGGGTDVLASADRGGGSWSY
jgi:hypothetical protein